MIVKAGRYVVVSLETGEKVSGDLNPQVIPLHIWFYIVNFPI